MTKFLHLVRRFRGAVSRANLMSEDLADVESLLLRDEFVLWQTMPAMDQRHSIAVMRRFKNLRPSAALPEIRAALLHDVGKIASDLGVFWRVVATLIGPRGRRFTKYHDHERIGGQMLREINSDILTIQLVAGESDTHLAEVLKTLHDADDI